MTEPLPNLLQRGTAAFAAGDFAGAASAFTQVESDYSTEREWTEGSLPQRLLPLRGFAELRAGLPAEASESLAAFLERFPDDSSQRSFVLYTLALALRQSGKYGEALERFSSYEAENAGTAQAALSAFQRAEILIEEHRADEALAVLSALAHEASGESLRTQARLRALQLSVDLEREADAESLLLGEPWAAGTMPEIAMLAFAAMTIGDRAMAAGRAEVSVRAYRLVLPKEKLLAAQRERLEELKTVFAERSAEVAAGNGAFWVEFYRARIVRIEAELQGLESSEDYTGPLRLRLGQAFLLAQRPREAWLAFESLALDPRVPAPLRSEAHYRWILAAAEIESWNEAHLIARRFTDNFPRDEKAPDVFYLIARAHLEARRFADAEDVLGDILEKFPEHAAAERARFTRGWVRVMLENFEPARDDFDRYVERHPDGPLAVNAALWRALTFFFERNYADALDSLDTLAATHPRHALAPEFHYRRGTTLYAMRDFARARDAMEEFVKKHPQHPRQPEALVLLGDILMAEGRLDEAQRRFAEVSPDAASSFIYGVFQTGKILRAQEDAAGMVAHFTRYATRDDLPAQPRLSEALYWIGWAEEQLGRPAAALPVYLDAVARFGNDPAAGEIGSTLGALERLVRRIRQGDGAPALDAAAPVDPRMQNLAEGHFDLWLDTESARAKAAKESTLHARLELFKAGRHAARKQPHQEEAVLLGIAGAVPLDALDAAGLARVGLALQEVGSPECAIYFKRLLLRHPSSFERATAFFGLAGEAAKERRTDDALRWVDRFENETPTHPLAPRVALLAGSTLERAGRLDEASSRFENTLRLKSARGRPHAEALMGLARCAIAAGDAKRAVAFCQRVYTLHRAQRDLAGDAYLHSGLLFEALDDLPAAAATYREMLALADIGTATQREQAARALELLEPRVREIGTAPAPVAPAS